MDITSHSARITGPVTYVAADGKKLNIPKGPCLVENLGGQLIDIIWGAKGQKSAALPLVEVEAARDHGNLVLID